MVLPPTLNPRAEQLRKHNPVRRSTYFRRPPRHNLSLRLRFPMLSSPTNNPPPWSDLVAPMVLLPAHPGSPIQPRPPPDFNPCRHPEYPSRGRRSKYLPVKGPRYYAGTSLHSLPNGKTPPFGDETFDGPVNGDRGVDLRRAPRAPRLGTNGQSVRVPGGHDCRDSRLGCCCGGGRCRGNGSRCHFCVFCRGL
jgi:hypothetical protein